MKTYISMLRGINVSGQKLIKMADLKTLYESIGFANVRTYIQSGNVIFSTAEHLRTDIITVIEKSIKNAFGFEVPVQLRSKEEIEEVLANLPFKEPRELNRLLVTFLEKDPIVIPGEKIAALKAPADQLVFRGKEIYLYLPEGYGKSKLDNNALERLLKVKATTRNWKTISKLYEMS